MSGAISPRIIQEAQMAKNSSEGCRAADLAGDITARVRGTKPYRPPRLERFGDLRALTREVGNTGMADSGQGSGKNQRTGLP